MIWLAVIGALGTIVSLGYYLRVVGVLWFPSPDAPATGRILPVPTGVGAVTIVSGLGVVAIALAADPIITVCRAAESLLGA